MNGTEKIVRNTPNLSYSNGLFFKRVVSSMRESIPPRVAKRISASSLKATETPGLLAGRPVPLFDTTLAPS